MKFGMHSFMNWPLSGIALRSLIAVYAITGVLTGCSPTKKILVEGRAYEEAGMFESAVERYETAYFQHGSVDAHIALKRMGEGKLAGMLSQARMALMSGQYELAMERLNEAYNYSKSKSAWGLSPAEGLLNEAQQVKEEYVNALIDESTALLMSGDFEASRGLMEKAYRQDRNNPKLAYLEMMLDIYPNYNLGKKAFDNGRNREAYRYMLKVIERDADFKDALQIKEEAQHLASFTLAFVPSAQSKSDSKLESVIASAVKQSILGLKIPFVQLVDRQNLQTLIREQQNSMDVLFDESLAQKAGHLVGAEYIVLGELLRYDNVLTSLKRTEKKGFMGATTRASKVKYNEAQRSRILNAVYKFSILHTETGRVYGSGNIPVALEDKVEYAEYSGDHQDLYPGDWKYGLISSSIDKVHGAEEKKQLDERFKARKEPFSYAEMELKMVQEIGAIIAKEVDLFEPEGH